MVALPQVMGKESCVQYTLRNQFFILAIVALLSGCGGSSSTASSGSSSSGTASSLTISPSSVNLEEDGSYTFSVSGGSGSGYSFSMGSGGSVAGSVSSSGTFQAVSGWTGTTYVIVTDSAGDQAYAEITVSGSSSGTTSTGTTSGALSISPSSIELYEGETYTFVASGGSGSYTYSIPTGDAGTVGSTSGVYLAPSAFTGTTLLEVSDTDGNVTYATITVVSSSGSTSTGSGTSTTTSITGTLTDCVGMVGGSENTNNWQVSGTELRTIDDNNYSVESPVYCTGLSVAGSIPSTATIQGISVSIFLINQSSSTDGSLLEGLTLINAGSAIGTTDSLDLAIPGKNASFPTFTEGGSTSLWGASLTPAIVNSSSFGIDIQTYRGADRLFIGNSSSITPQVTIYYSE